jgi:hypothetical protein
VCDGTRRGEEYSRTRIEYGNTGTGLVFLPSSCAGHQRTCFEIVLMSSCIESLLLKMLEMATICGLTGVILVRFAAEDRPYQVLPTSGLISQRALPILLQGSGWQRFKYT